jgi:molybdate transport system substrate-binding protein
MTGSWWGMPSRSLPWRVILLCLTLALAGGAIPANMGTAMTQSASWECSEPTAAAPAVATPATSTAAEMDPAAIHSAEGALTVFAAASLTDAFEAVKADLEAANPVLSITYNFGGSQALVTQLTEGAAADIFASANTAQMAAAEEAGVIASAPVTFVRNRLAIVTPADNPVGIGVPADLGGEGIRLVLAQPEVPAGRYARESVCAMATETAVYGEDFVARVAANLVSEEEDVRNVLAKVQLGEADAGIVYVSDAAAAGAEVAVIPIPDDKNILATYPVAAVTGGNESIAGAFIAYLLGDEGQATLQDYGFEPVA